MYSVNNCIRTYVVFVVFYGFHKPSKKVVRYISIDQSHLKQ